MTITKNNATSLATVDNSTEELATNETQKHINLSVRQATAQIVMKEEGFDLVKAQLDAELEKNLRQLSVTEFISPTSLLDSAEPLASSAPFSLLDCFDFEFQDKDEIKALVIYLCDFGDEGIKTVAQTMSNQRERWINAFNSARVAKIQITLTNVRFRRLAKGGRAGNFPIIIELTKESAVLKHKI